MSELICAAGAQPGDVQEPPGLGEQGRVDLSIIAPSRSVTSAFAAVEHSRRRERPGPAAGPSEDAGHGGPLGMIGRAQRPVLRGREIWCPLGVRFGARASLLQAEHQYRYRDSNPGFRRERAAS